jgi:hypothetical protein
MALTVAASNGNHGSDRGPGLFLRHIANQDSPVLTNIRVAGREKAKDRSGAWLRAAMVALGILSATAAVVSYQAQYKLIFAFKAVKVIALLQAGIPDVASLVFASLGIALALSGKRALRARALNVASVATSVAMNLLAAGHGWKALSVWALAPVAYAVTSDTLIGVLRAYTVARQRELNADLADDERTVLDVLGRFALWTLRLVLAPPSTLRGFRTWVVEEAPVAPGRKAQKPIKAIPITWPPVASGPVVPITSRPRPVTSKPEPVAPRSRKPRTTTTAPKRAGSKQASLIHLATDKHGLATLPLDQVSRLATKLAPEVGIHPATARRVLVNHARTIQNGAAK